MLITRKKEVSLLWVFYAQLPFTLSIWAGGYAQGTILLSLKKFIDNPAAITFWLSLDVVVTVFNGSFFNWLSDRIWTKYGRRKVLIAISDAAKFIIVPLIPFAPDMWTLIILKWLYTIFADMGTPNQALTMEVVPTKQRGRGSGFFNMQIQVINLISYLIIIGRWDDVYFMGPFYHLISLSGEHLMFISGGLIFAAVGIYTFFGIKEIKPPAYKSLQDGRKPGENLIMMFLRSFFKDILGKELLPLYLLITVGIMTGLGLGILGPLLYTEQWGYSLQDMGTNVAIGAAINIGLALLVGYFADATSKMKVYTFALVMGLVIKVVWVVYVFFKPDYRPALWEIVLFGEIGAVFGLMAGVVSFPLILEYVERNKLGTAGAGMGLYRQLATSFITMFIGAWVLWWSVWFLPQAGDRVELVFKEESGRAAVEKRLAALDDPEADIHIEPLHRPGVDRDTSRRWEARNQTAWSTELQKEMKDLENDVNKWSSSLQSPIISQEKKARLKTRIREGEARIEEMKTKLRASAEAFREKLVTAMSPALVDQGKQILEAEMRGHDLILALQTVEEVNEELAAKLEAGLDSFEYRQIPDRENKGEFRSDITVEALAGEQNGFRFTGRRDPNFTVLNRALAAGGADLSAALDKCAILLGIFRDIYGRAEGAFTIHEASYDPDTAGFLLSMEVPPGPRVTAPEQVAVLLEETPELASARAETRNGRTQFQMVMEVPPPPREAGDASGVSARFAELLGGGAYARLTMEHLYKRVVATAAAAPVFLTVPRPVVEATYSERKYDYFFSVYILMILTDFLGLGVIVLIVKLEKKGVIHRRGVEEDAAR